MSTSRMGAGSTPAGSSMGGYGTPATATSPGVSTLPDGVGGTGTGRYIDPATKAYAVDANWNLLGMSTASQLVQIALSDSSNMPQVLGDGAERRVSAWVSDKLSGLVARGVITVGNVKIERTSMTPTRVAVLVQWVDTSNGNKTTTIV